MIESYINILCCPICKSDLILQNETLVCTNCAKQYNIINGIPVLLPDLSKDVRLSLHKWNAEYEHFDYQKHFNEYKEKYIEDTVHQIENCYAPKEGDRYLEIGCGPAFLGTYFANKGLSVCGIDMSLSILQVAKKSYTNMGLNCFLVCGDINQMPFKDNLFDLIYGGGVIEHFKSTDVVLDETYRVLRGGGICFNTVPYLNLGALTYRQKWGNIPNLPILKQLAEFVHINLLKGKHMRFGYELSFTKKQLEHLYQKAGYRNVSTHKFAVNLSLEYLPDGILREIARQLADNSQLFWPMIYVMGKKK